MGAGRSPLVVVGGPTGVGKTAVAVALARRLPIEVVSADSRQVYRGMDVATGKPSADERRAVPHHLVDVVDPDDRYHAARFRDDARAVTIRAADGRADHADLNFAAILAVNFILPLPDLAIVGCALDHLVQAHQFADEMGLRFVGGRTGDDLFGRITGQAGEGAVGVADMRPFGVNHTFIHRVQDGF